MRPRPGQATTTMTEGEVLELQRMAWVIKGLAREVNGVAQRMRASTDELRALREDLGIQPPRPFLQLVGENDD
jgi:hypothetical protein